MRNGLILAHHKIIIELKTYNMIKNNKVLCLITARSGSKGLKNKNILKLGSHPLLAWPIQAAIKSKFIDDVVVSTDCTKIAKIARKYSAETPFLRPKYLAKDTSSSIDVILHALKKLNENYNRNYQYLILLEPTSPFTTAKDIDTSLKLLIKKNNYYKALISVTSADKYHPSYSLHLSNSMGLKKANYIVRKHTRRQDLESVYFPDGSIYISDVSYLEDKKSFYHTKTLGKEFPKWKSIEIDDLLDFNYAQSIINNNTNFK